MSDHILHDICSGSGDKYVSTAGAVGARVPLQQGPAYPFLSLESQPEEAIDVVHDEIFGCEIWAISRFETHAHCRPGPLDVINFGSARR